MNLKQEFVSAIILSLLSLDVVGQEIILGNRYVLYSEGLQEDRTFMVSLPDSYDLTSSSHKTYPVLIVLDGDAYFKSASATVQFLSSRRNGNYLMPETIVVAISNVDRERDFTATKIEMVRKNKTGGGDRFLEFLEKELIPYLDQNYRTEPFRTLAGHSLGGLITMHAYLKENSLFNAYISMDPSIWWEEEMLNSKVTSISEQSLRNSLFIATANNGEAWVAKNKPKHDKIYELLEEISEEKLNAEIKYYENERHRSVPLIALHDGLRSVYSGYQYLPEGDESVEEMVSYYEKLSDRLSYKVPPPERIINRLGYRSISDKNMEKAMDFFELNTLNYPGSSNAFDSLAEAYKAIGNKEKALEHYKKALELNPENENARTQIVLLSE